MSARPNAQRRRVVADLAAIRDGRHPLTTRLDRPVALHRLAVRTAQPGRKPEGPSCGGCALRRTQGGSGPWCRRLGQDGPTIPNWWPACSRYRKPSPRGVR